MKPARTNAGVFTERLAMQSLRIILLARITTVIAAGFLQVSLLSPVLVGGLLIGLCSSATVQAQLPDAQGDENPEDEEALAAELDDLLLEGEESLLDGEFHAAIELFEKALEIDADLTDTL